MIFNLKSKQINTALLAGSFALLAIGNVSADTGKLEKFTSELENKLESYLRKELGREKVAFDITLKKTGSKYNLAVPDYIERETVFSVNLDLNEKSKTISLNGKVLTEDEKAFLSQTADKYFPEYRITNNLATFPYNDVGLDYGLVNKAVINAFVTPKADSLATQLLLGTPVKILEYSANKKFIRVQSADDRYISWISRADVNEADNTKYSTWNEARNAVVINTLSKPYKIHYSTILPVTANTQNPAKVFVELPDGKNFETDKKNVRFLSAANLDFNEVISSAQAYLKAGEAGKSTYLWGGTAGYDLDCSGFNQTVFKASGVLLPRDADQQQNFTVPVAKTLKEIDQLKPGDLVFFSENRQYATHTGIYAGNYKVIHSSKGGKYGGIKLSYLKGGNNYDKSLQKIYFGGGRLKAENNISRN